MENLCVLSGRCVGWTGRGGEGGLAGDGEVRVKKRSLWARRCLSEAKILLLQAQKEQRRTIISPIHLDSMLGQDVRPPAWARDDGFMCTAGLCVANLWFNTAVVWGLSVLFEASSCI